jgi:4-carboxymuconolactone decarboxylase
MDDAYERFSRQAAEERTERGRKRYREVMGSEPPPGTSVFTGKGVVDSVFAELWDRPGLSTRDRRWITLACAGAAGADQPIQSHVHAALASGDISREEFQEFVLHFAYYHGWPRASAMEGAYYRAVAELDAAETASDD